MRWGDEEVRDAEAGVTVMVCVLVNGGVGLMALVGWWLGGGLW